MALKPEDFTDATAKLYNAAQVNTKEKRRKKKENGSKRKK